MTDVGYATLAIIPSAKGFGAALSKGVDPELRAAGVKGGKQVGDGLKSTASGHGAAVGKILGKGLAIGLGLAVAGIAAVLKTGFGEAMDASAGTAQLAAGIKSTGNAAGVSVKGLNALASSIQGYSGQTDDSIVKSEQLLLTFTNIRNSGADKIFDLATQASADMAAKMGGDASGSAIQLGKALNDPVKGVTALQRVGVSFTAGQKKTIESLVKTGDVVGAQKIILGELNKEFGGAAKAAGQSMPGQLARARRSFEDVTQSVAEGLLPVVLPGLLKVGSVITGKVIPAVSGFITSFRNGTGSAGTLRDVLEKVGGALGKTVSIGRSFVGFIREHNTLAMAGATVLGLLVIAVQAHNLALAISSGRLKAWVLQTTVVKVATATWAAVQWVLNAAMTANPIGLVVIAVAALIAIFIIAWKRSETFRNIVTNAWLTIQIGALELAAVAVGAFRGLLSFFLTMVSGLLNGAATAFGWVPGLGPKLKVAAEKMEGFKNSTNASLAKVEKDLHIKADTKAAELAIIKMQQNAAKPVTVPVFLRTNFTSGTINVTGVGVVNAGRRAGGGPVTAGQSYIVGENRPELFVPDVSGHIVPQVPSLAGATSQRTRMHPDDLAALADAVSAGAYQGTSGGMGVQARSIASRRR